MDSKNICNKVTFSGYLPGSLATLCAIQSAHYAKELGFDHLYESVVATGVGEFLGRYQPSKDFVRIVSEDHVVKGGIVIDSRDGTLAQLRWFILDGTLRGSGIGKTLISEAMEFVREREFPRVFLTTVSGLDAARRLYEYVGFNLVEEKSASTWGREVVEQRFEWAL